MDTMNPRGKTVRHRCVSITQGAGPFGTGTPSQRQPLAETVAMPRPGPCPRVAAALGGAAARVSGRSWVAPWAGRAAPHNARAGLASRAFPLPPPRGPRPAGRPIESKEKERWRRQAAGVALRLDGGGRSSETGVWRLRCCGLSGPGTPSAGPGRRLGAGASRSGSSMCSARGTSGPGPGPSPQRSPSVLASCTSPSRPGRGPGGLRPRRNKARLLGEEENGTAGEGGARGAGGRQGVPEAGGPGSSKRVLGVGRPPLFIL